MKRAYVRQRGGRWETVCEFGDRLAVVGSWAAKYQAVEQAAELDHVEPCEVEVED
jgi:hypothetical protein